jgi:hypothetical protein
MEQLVYDEVTKTWMSQATLDELKKQREEQQKKEEE